MRVKPYLVFFRWHTASLTIPAMLVGIYLAGQPLFSWTTLVWILAGWLFHATGFAHNNLADYKWDKEDKSKQHHPMITGEVSVEVAYGLVYIFFFISTALITALTVHSKIAFALFIITVFAGIGYNYLSKITLISPILISICFGFLPGVSYFAYSDNVNTGILLVLGYAFFQILFQISVEGYIKDIEHDPVNLYRKFGCKVENGEYKGTLISKLYGYAIKMPMVIFGSWIGLYYHTSIYAIVIAILIFLCVLCCVDYLVMNKKWKRDNILRACAITEILTYFGLVFVGEGVWGWEGVLFLVGFPIAWFIIWNKIYWNTWIRPQV